MRLNREAFAYLEELTEKSVLHGQAQPKLSVCFGDTPVSIAIYLKFHRGCKLTHSAYRRSL